MPLKSLKLYLFVTFFLEQNELSMTMGETLDVSMCVGNILKKAVVSLFLSFLHMM